MSNHLNSLPPIGFNTIRVAEKFKPLFSPKRTKVFYGGRGGAKSWGYAQALLIQAANKKMRVLCTREFQGSIADSVHKLLSETIDRLGLSEFYEIQRDKIIGKNGSEFLFSGLKNNITKIKSMEGIDVVWCEEAESITEMSWDILLPTIRKMDSEVWISFNPFDEMDSTYAQFVTPYVDHIEEHTYYEDDDIIVCKVGWRDNPWFMQTSLNKERLKCKREDYNKYLHIWEGEPSRDFSDSIIKPEWIHAAINAHITLKWQPRGAKVVGFDPADTGTDSKAYCIRYGSLITHMDQWKTGDLEEGAERVYNAAIDQQCEKLVYDSIGIGAGAKIKFKQLNGAGGMDIQGFCGSETPEFPFKKYMDDKPNRDVFRNRRAQGYWYLRDRFEATYRAVVKGEDIDPEDMISLDSALPHLKQLRSELARVKRKVGHNDNSLIQIESKKDMASRGVKSPNLADALMYTFSNKSGSGGMTVGNQRFAH